MNCEDKSFTLIDQYILCVRENTLPVRRRSCWPDREGMRNAAVLEREERDQKEIRRV